MLTSKQLAEELNVSEQVIWRLAREKKVPHIKIGRENRFDLEKVKAALTPAEFKEGGTDHEM